MSKPQKEKSLTKDRLVGMKVISAEGKLVGTIKDVGFTVGKAGISLSVEDEEGDVQDFEWESIQGAVDFVVLKPAQAAQAVAQPMAQAAQPVQVAQPAKPLCPTCHQPLTYIQQYQRWYCYTEKKYV